MELSDILSFTLVASLLVMSPGPNGALITKTVTTSGRAAGFANVAGFVTGFYLHGTMTILGLSIILVQSSSAFTIVKYLGAAYLLWIGIKLSISAWQGIEPQENLTTLAKKRTLRNAYAEGFLTNALNPKVAMFYLAAFPQFISVGETSPIASYSLVIIHSLINAIWFGAMVLVMSRFTAIAQSGRFQRYLKGLTGLVFIGFAGKLASYKAGF